MFPLLIGFFLNKLSTFSSISFSIVSFFFFFLNNVTVFDGLNLAATALDGRKNFTSYCTCTRSNARFFFMTA